MKPILGLFLSLALLAPLHAEPLQPGDDAPALQTQDQHGAPVDLGEQLKEGVSLVYFYPKADTPGCTKQACNIRDQKALLGEAGIKVFGVSADAVDRQKSFADKFKLDFTLIADHSGEVIKAFGVPTNPKGFAARQSFLVKDGKVIWHQPKAAPMTQAEDAIAALEAAAAP